MVECLLCKEDALGSNPSGSMLARSVCTEVLLRDHPVRPFRPADRCTTPCERGWEGSNASPWTRGA